MAPKEAAPRICCGRCSTAKHFCTSTKEGAGIMLNLPGHRGCNCEGPTRRELLRIGSIGLMGLSLPHFFLWRDQAYAATASKYAGARGWESAKNVVMIFLQGGPSHIEIWDPRPDEAANIRGEFE